MCAYDWCFQRKAFSWSFPKRLSVEVPRSATILLPGYLGSALRDVHTGKRIYMNLARVALRPSVLALYHAELETPRGPEVEADGILRDVKVFPGLFTVDVYATLIRKLESLPDHRVIALGYDWRHSPYSAVQTLGAMVDRLRSEGITQIDIVAHSYGGIITAYYLGYGTQAPERAALDWSGARNIRKIALLGTPFRGGFIMFRNLIRGIGLPVIWRLFPREAVASYPSNYHLLPFGTIRLYNWTGRPWAISALDPEFWINWNLGLMANQDLPAAIRSNRASFIRKQLASARRFGERLQFSETPIAPDPPTRILTVIGNGAPTEDSAYYKPSGGDLTFVFRSDDPKRFALSESTLLQDGDNKVTVGSATLPSRLRPLAETRLVRVCHERLVTDSRVQDMVLDFLDR
jgi:pimeloyl-ACP methyl ester carboxylesterase